MSRLIHLNGPPGIGKSTLARRWATDHPGTLILDVDVLRTFVAGWADDYSRAGALIRPVALAGISAYLAHGGDVVLPQLIARPEELARFRAAAEGADYRHLVLTAPAEELARRFAERSVSSDPAGPAAAAAREVADKGAGALLRRYGDDVRALAARDPDARLVETEPGDVDATYTAVCAALAQP